MTSPVDTSVKFFTNSMANAPVLNGTAGALIALLDACLKDGFDSKAVTSLVALGGVMTATYAGTHSAQVDSVVLIAGVTGGPSGFAGANGEQKITGAPTATTRTWATALPDGTYTGTITMKMAPLGWLKPFAGTNLAAYKSADVMATGMFLRVDDTGTMSARVVGYEMMTDVNTGLGPFPTPVQMSGGGYWAKSVVASAAAASWVLVGDGRTFIIHVAAGSSQVPAYVQGATRGFGDAIALKPGGDPYACFLNYSVQSGAASQNDSALDAAPASAYSSFPRSYTGVGSAVAHFSLQYVGTNALSGNDNLFGPFPSVVDGSLKLSRRYFTQIATVGNPPRAEVPGLFSVPQISAFDVFRTNDRVTATGVYAGRSLLALNPTSAAMNGSPNATNTGVSFVDITGPWR